MNRYDVVIVGGGLVGVTLACALRDAPLSVALLEAVPFDVDTPPSFDDRALALSPATQRVLSGIGIWPSLAPDATPVRAIHISERGRFGAVRLYAEEFDLEALAHVSLARDLGSSLLRCMQQRPNCELHCPARVVGVRHDRAAIGVTVQRGEERYSLEARLLIVADGAQSPTRGLLNIKVRQRDYGQAAIIANLRTDRPHDNVAYERFTPDGPAAVLPQQAGRCGLVYVAPTAAATAAASLPDGAFLAQAQDRLGRRLGELSGLGRRSMYPLRLAVADRVSGDRHIVVGNAAHGVHPNGAQGFNLGVRDAAVAAECIIDAMRAGRDIGEGSVTDCYAERCRADHRRTVRFTDGLVRLFCNESWPHAVARQAVMLGVELVPPLKRRLVVQGSGLRGVRSRLLQGRPL
ncbi:MAG: 2-octaprenyl-6-methoxyphenol hydroxylase [Gammaproteobacteria bacterium]|nr:2-octaprenyl-6-methoxyphenol hydroxylase [Gammaproteobacteria bacterium]